MMTQTREMTFIHHRPTKNPSQGAEPNTTTGEETSALETSPYASHLGHRMTMLETQQNILYLSTDRQRPREGGLGEQLRYLKATSVSVWLVTCVLRIAFMTHFSEMLSFWTFNALL